MGIWPWHRFDYTNGPVRTRRPWRRPTWPVFEAWREDFLSLAGAGDYDVWLCGGFLQGQWPTWDVDVVLSGEIKPEVLQPLLIEGLRLALDKHRLLVDLQHLDHPPTAPLDLAEPELITRTVISPLVTKNGRILTDWREDPTLKQIGEHLWQVRRQIPDASQRARLERGMVYRQPARKLSD